jgi:hypothetical protein
LVAGLISQRMATAAQSSADKTARLSCGPEEHMQAPSALAETPHCAVMRGCILKWIMRTDGLAVRGSSYCYAT